MISVKSMNAEAYRKEIHGRSVLVDGIYREIEGNSFVELDIGESPALLWIASTAGREGNETFRAFRDGHQVEVAGLYKSFPAHPAVGDTPIGYLEKAKVVGHARNDGPRK